MRQARIDRPVDKRRASHTLPLPRFLPKGALGQHLRPLQAVYGRAAALAPQTGLDEPQKVARLGGAELSTSAITGIAEAREAEEHHRPGCGLGDADIDVVYYTR